MAIKKEVLDELMKENKGPYDFYGPEGLIKQFWTKVCVKLLSKGRCKRRTFG